MSRDPSHEITDLLVAWRRGDGGALAELTPKVYRDLKRTASSMLRRESVADTLQTTALVNETFARLIDADAVSWQDRAHFFAISARLMRRVLIESARRRGRLKRGAGAPKLSLDDCAELALARDPLLIELDTALHDLAERDKTAASIVELRFFGGLNRNEIAEVLGISSATVTRRWRMARAWLHHSLAAEPSAAGLEKPAREAREAGLRE